MSDTGTIHDVLADINELNRNLTDRYPLHDGFPVFKELVQNADDAGASHLCVSWHQGLLQSTHPLLQGPALLVINNGKTCGQDLLNIRRLGVNYKAGERGVIGRFGLGLKSIFHLCEAFFYFAFDPESDEVALQQRPKGHLYNPWNGGSEGNRYHSDWDDVDEEQFALIVDAFAPMTPASRWFGLWIPLRQSSHGSEPIIGQYFGDTGDSKAEYVPDHLAARLARLLPALTTLETIEIRHIRSSDSIDQVERVTVHPGAVRRERDISKIEATPRSFFGSIEVFSSKSQSKSTLRWYGQECCLDSGNVSDLTASLHWPKSRSRNHRSGQPQTIDAPKDAHCAVVLIEPENAADKLSIRHACYLPLNMVHEESGHSLSIDELLLHARFFVDAGRQEVKGFSGDHKTEIPQNDEQLKAAWNRRLFERGTTRLLLPTVCDWAEASSIDDTKLQALTRVLQKCRFVQDWRYSICGEWQWLYRLEVNERGDSLSGSFQCVETDVPILTIPPAENDVPLLKLCPRLTHYLKSHALSYSDWPRITSVDDPAGWPSSHLTRLIKSIDPTIALACADNLQYLADFLEHCAISEDQRQAAGEAIWPILKRAFQSESVDLGHIESLAVPLQRVLEFVPVEHRLVLKWAKTDREGAAEAFRLIASDAYDVLPIPFSVRPSGGDCGKISSDAVVRMLRGIEKLSLKSELLADIVGDLLNRADKNRESLSNQLTTLQLLLVHNGLSKQPERVTWAEFEKQKSRRLIFCDQAELTEQLQAALGDAGAVWRIDPTFAEKVLGKEHGLPGCSAREWVDLLTPNRDGRLPRFAPRQTMSDWPDRVELLAKLIEQIDWRNSDDHEKARDACRFLMHGRIPDAGFNGPLFVAKSGESDPLAEKLARHILGRRIDPDTRTSDEWQILSGDTATWAMESLTVNQRRLLKLIPLKLTEPELIELLQRARPAHLAGLHVTEDEYANLLDAFTEQTPDLMKRLPVHPTVDGRHVAIDADGSYRVFWDDGYRLDVGLQHSAVLLQMHKDKKVRELQAKLGDVLGPQQAVEMILKTATPEKYWRSILKAIKESEAPFAEQVLKGLQSKRWFPTRYGARSTEDLIFLTAEDPQIKFPESFIAHINTLVNACSAAFVPSWLFDNHLQKAIQDNSAAIVKRLQEWNILPNLEESLERLGLLLGEFSENTIGYLSPERFEEWLETDWNAELMPIHGVLKEAADRFGIYACYHNVTSDIRKPITSFSRLQDILHHLADQHRSTTTRAERKYVWSMFQTYFRFLLGHCECTRTSKLESLLLLSQDGTWQAPAELCLPPASGISGKNVLAEELSTLVRELRPEASSAGSESKSGRSEHSAYLTGSAELRGLEASENSVDMVEQYFRSWEGYLPSDVIGGFVGLLGGDPRMEELANRYLGKRSLDETRRNLHITSSAIGPRPLRMSDQRVHVVIASEDVTQAVNLLGQEFEAPLVAEIKTILVGFGSGRHVEVSELDGVRTLMIRLRRFAPSTAGLDAVALTKLLAAAAETLLIEGFRLQASEELRGLVKKTYEDLQESDQLEIRVTQQLILEDAELLLSQLGLQSDPVLGPVLAELTKYKRLRAERDHNQSHFGRPASVTEDELKNERNTPNKLRNLLESNKDGQARVLAAVRKRVQGHNQYNPAAIPFELFQNADDACQERHEKFQSSFECDSLQFHIGSDLMAVQHLGRCVNQVPPGADPRTHRLADDLRKMLTPWLSSKDASDHETTDIQLTGKFGLGFKSVFLVSDRPRILSGRIACEIVGGVFPKHISVDQQASFNRYMETITSDARREATVIELPLTRTHSTGDVTDREGAFPVSEIVRRFNDLAHVLVVFARQIRKIHVHSDILGRDYSTRWADTAVPEVPHCFKGTLQPLPNLVNAGEPPIKADRVLLLRCTRHSGALLLAHDGQKFINFPDDMPTIWVTAPTLHCLNAGFALNANFSLDPGRAQLGRESPENERIARDLGRELGERLVGLFSHSRNVGWKQFCSDVGFDPTANEYEMWDSLWGLLGSSLAGLPTTSADASLLRQTFWGEEGAARKLYRECPVLPSRLKGASFRNELSTLLQVRFAVRGILANDDGYGLMCVRDWPAFKERMGNGHVISERVASQLRTLLNPATNGVQKAYELTDLLAWEISDQSVTPEDAQRFGEVFASDALQKCDRGEEERLRKLLGDLRFNNRKGDFVTARELVVGHQPQGAPPDSRSDERMRAMFAPEDRVLSGEYSAVGLSFFEVCRERLNAPASELAVWVLRANTEAKREAARIYLADGELGRAVQTEIKLRGGIQGTWLEGFAKSDEFREMTPMQQGQLVGLLSDQQGQRVIDSIVKNAEQSSYSTHANPAEALKRIHRWWMTSPEVNASQIRLFDPRIHGPISRDYDRNNLEHRKAWMRLFMLGMNYTHGHTQAAQDAGFLMAFCEEKRWIDRFVEHSGEESRWVHILREYLEPQVDDNQYLHWMRQFVGIFAVAERLDDYVESFLSIDRYGHRFPLTNITCPRASQQSPVDPPPISRILGMGACFVVRELLRNGIIESKWAHEHAFVPSGGVRSILTQLGCQFDNVKAGKWSWSRDIASFLRTIAPNGMDLSFSLAFDIPFQMIWRNPSLREEFLIHQWIPDEGEGDYDW